MQTIVPEISFITYSLGCRTNQAELEVISDQLSVFGFKYLGSTNTKYLITNTKPNLILINTCMVTQKAERETRKTIRHFKKLYPKAIIVVLGCAVAAKDKFKINLPEADLLISNLEKPRAKEIIHKYCSSLSTLLEINSVENHNVTTSRLVQNNTGLARRIEDTKSEYEESGRKFIKIQDGCSNCCSFCITTHLRGEPRSEEPEKIINTINELTNSKIKEVILTGINIGLYGIDLKPQTNIWSLVDRILQETTIERLTLSTVYPEMLDKLQIINNKSQIIKNPRLTKCFHIALQSGSQSVLNRMNRPTDLKKLLKAINEIRKIQPDFIFRADVIAGFPDETEEEHEETLEFIRQAKICFAHVFPYSPRVGTVAYEMIQKKKWQDLPMEVKRRRAREIKLLVGKLSSKLSRGMIGKTYRTLIVREIPRHSRFNRESIQMNGDNYIDSVSRHGMTRFEGFTENGLSVVINNLPDGKAGQQQAINNERGTIQSVRITGYEENHLIGTILSLPI